MDELYTSNNDDPTTVNFSERSTVRCEKRIQNILKESKPCLHTIYMRY